eukprot:TRINITY_DN19064_c0_g1_i1.p1 TRINITY_DN19064_c0_g1~~TRINITY_DN19064_c0_g1_i1.p1  ORF type:complete len:135 (-),score=22.54 TRINITY_DN19064_c0_g1_i1:18-386(-)
MDGQGTDGLSVEQREGEWGSDGPHDRLHFTPPSIWESRQHAYAALGDIDLHDSAPSPLRRTPSKDRGDLWRSLSPSGAALLDMDTRDLHDQDLDDQDLDDQDPVGVVENVASTPYLEEKRQM